MHIFCHYLLYHILRLFASAVLKFDKIFVFHIAGVAQSVEQRIRNAQVGGVYRQTRRSRVL